MIFRHQHGQVALGLEKNAGFTVLPAVTLWIEDFKVRTLGGLAV